MASLSSHPNVYNTCLRILRQQGYRLWTKFERDSDGCIIPSTQQWFAEKAGYDFLGDNPIELLGLTAIFDFQKPPDDPQPYPRPYWWSVEGTNIWEELVDAANPNQLD